MVQNQTLAKKNPKWKELKIGEQLVDDLATRAKHVVLGV
jgi:hypothetical protein